MIKKENKKSTRKTKTKENLKKNTKNIKEEIVVDENIVWEKLTEKQKLFCFHYICNDVLRWNATLAYNEAYNFNLDEKNKVRDIDENWKEIYGTSEYDKSYNVCSVNWNKLLRNTKIQKENQKLLNSLLNDKKVNSKLAEIIFNWKYSDSLNAIKIYNDLNARIEKAKQKAIDSWEITKEVLDPLSSRLEKLWIL